ncbi:MAG: formimidoylglutamase [candidate division Zixibacteria bacterium]|nr:formimidoylglutamase [candidate division Zixibacteria bacterium]
MDFSEFITPISEEVFYSRHDPNDIRLGDRVYREFADYSKSSVVLLGCPQDIGIKRNKGRTGSRFAPFEIRKYLYRYPLSIDHQHLRLIDLGDVKIQDSLEDTHEILYKLVRQFIQDGKLVIVLGGGNDISYPDCAALSSDVNPILVFNIDRHLDVRADQIRNSGTPYRQLLEEKLIEPDLFHEFGINSYANSETYIKYIENIGSHIHTLGDVRNQINKIISDILKNSDVEGIFWGFDIDVVRAIEAPGVSDPGPMGITAREICEIADFAARDPRTRLIEITEVNPEYDIDGITCKLAANIIVRALVRENSYQD